MGVIVPNFASSTEDRTSGAQVIDGGLRFDSRKSQRLTRTPSSDGNRKTWTWSAWVKTIPGAFSASNHKNLFSVDGGASDATRMHMFIGNASDKLQHDLNASSPRVSSSVYRDVSGWYHVVVKFDSTQSTARNQIAWYINGQQVVNWDTENSITQNNDFGINGTYLHAIGSNLAAGPGQFFDGLMSRVYLIDGQALDSSYFGYTDPLTNTWRPKKFKPQATPNNGTTWSNYWSGGILGGYPATDSFDGNIATSTRTSGGTLTWSPPSPIPFTTLKLYAGRDGSPTGEIYVNGTNVSSQFGANASWVTVTGVTSPLTSIALKEISSQYPRLSAVEIDGVILLDNDTTNIGKNGFYLPLDGNTPIGQDQSGRGNNWTPVNFGGSNTIEKATGALPILNTDGGGKVARVGVRTDSNSSSLVLALPLVGIKSDFSNKINGGTTEKVVTINGSAAASSAQSNFYGGSFSFSSAGNLSIPSNSDFDLTGDFTVECWFYINAFNGASNSSVICSRGSNGWIVAAGDGSSTYIIFGQYGVGAVVSSTQVAKSGKWYHYAATREGSTVRLFLDGVLQQTATNSTSFSNSSSLAIGVDNNNSSQLFNGYIQDFRIYKGTAKYTQNFIPASTDPDILPDTPSGVAYSSNVALVPSTDGAVAFDGSTSYLTLSSSSDFTFGTNNYTIECFVYYNSTSSGYVYDFRSGDANAPALSISSGTLYAGGAGNNMTVSNIATGKWYHIALVRNSNTETIYIDGVAYNTQSNANNLAQTALTIGRRYAATFYYHSGIISNLHIVNGTALYTSNFTPPTAPITSVANTKLLCCKSNSSATAFDVSPGTITANGNAAATNFNPFTVNINTQRGQESGYCTLNPLDSFSTLSNGNLSITTPSSNFGTTRGTVGVSSGKWYFEHFVVSGATALGVKNVQDYQVNSQWAGYTSGSYVFYSENNGYNKKANNNVQTDYGTNFGAGSTLGVALDLDAGTITFYVNGISQGVAYTGLSGTFSPVISDGTNAGTISGDTNFGQKPFKFPPPAGFQPLALANTPRPTIVRPDQYVGVTTYTGNGTGSGQTKFVNTSFKADLIWIKDRDASNHHVLQDSVRGFSSTKLLSPNNTNGENVSNDPTDGAQRGYISESLYNGFTVVDGNNSTYSQINKNGTRYVAWHWKAGGNSNTYNIDDVGYATASAAGLTAGTITPSGASVNTKSGFSIIAYTGTGANATISHGLGNAPSFILIKKRTSSPGDTNWRVYHSALGNTKAIFLSTDGASDTNSVYWNNTSPTSSVFSLGSDDGLNASSQTHIAYLWAEIPGFSKFGTYVCTSNSDGPTIITGFRPKIVILKCYDSTSGWAIYDSERNKFNPMSNTLLWNSSNAENTPDYGDIDFLSNGFKIRASAGAYINNTPDDFIWMAFAETPSFNLYGGQANAR